MKRAIRLLLACSTTSVVAAVADGPSVSACSCVSSTDQEAFDGADVVFSGALVDVVTSAGDSYVSTDPARFVFDVEQVYKGDAVDPQTIVTARDGASCGLEIRGPGPFLVYATSTDSIVSGAAEHERYSNLCSGTRALAADAVPATFGAGRAPTPLATGVDDDASAVPWTAVAVVTAAATALGGGLIALHRRGGTP